MAKRVIESLGTLVKRLRLARGMTQRELADEAGYLQETLARVEQGRGRFSQRSGRAVLRAITKGGRVRMDESLDFFIGIGIAPEDAREVPPDLLGWLREHDMLSDDPLNAAPPPPPDVAARIDSTLAEFRPLITEAIDAIGKERLESILRALAGSAVPPVANGGTQLSYVSPPHRLPDGTVEQVIHQVSERPASPAAKPSGTLRRSASGG